MTCLVSDCGISRIPVRFLLWKGEGLVGWTLSTTEGRGPCVQRWSFPSTWSCGSWAPLEFTSTGFWPEGSWGHIVLVLWREGQEHALNIHQGKEGSMLWICSPLYVFTYVEMQWSLNTQSPGNRMSPASVVLCCWGRFNQQEPVLEGSDR